MPKPNIPETILRVAESTIEEGRRLIIRAYGVIAPTEYFMRDSVNKILQKFQRTDLAPAIAMIIKELTVNATKANFKKILFLEHNINVDDPVDYERGMQLFRDAISETMSMEYGLKAKKASLNVVASFDFDKDRLIVEIRNNLAMSRLEESRVRDKLRQAMECEDVAEFMMENVDETEGAGLGIILSLAALRSLAIDPHVLSISTNYEDMTVARLEIPLSTTYTPERLKPREDFG
jgi:hypothetical protein